MPLPYESYRQGTGSSRAIDHYEPSTPSNPTPRQDRRSTNYTDNSLASKSSTPYIMDESSSMDMSLDLDTPVAATHLNSTRIKSSDMSPLAAFNAAFEHEPATEIEKELADEFEKNIGSGSGLGKDVEMGGLEAELEAVLEADVSEEE